jgi:hypothetical protein
MTSAGRTSSWTCLTSPCWATSPSPTRRPAPSRGVEAVGDAREAEKNDLYADMAQQCEMEFGALVLYTYGGFHSSALKFISQMAKAVDPATCLTSPSQWKRELMEQIAIAVQRGNANIMIRAARQQRGRPWGRRRRPNAVTSSLSSRSHGRGRGSAQDAAEGEGRQPWSKWAMTHVARLIGLPIAEVGCRDRHGSAIESDAETEVEGWEVSPSTTPSVIPETPPRDQGGQQTEERISVEQRQGVGEGTANVCNHEGIAVGGDRDHAVHRCTESTERFKSCNYADSTSSQNSFTTASPQPHRTHTTRTNEPSHYVLWRHC